MKKSFYFVLIILSISAFNNSYSQKVLTLDDAITIALNQNTNVVKSTNSIATISGWSKKCLWKSSSKFKFGRRIWLAKSD